MRYIKIFIFLICLLILFSCNFPSDKLGGRPPLCSKSVALRKFNSEDEIKSDFRSRGLGGSGMELQALNELAAKNSSSYQSKVARVKENLSRYGIKKGSRAYKSSLRQLEFSESLRRSREAENREVKRIENLKNKAFEGSRRYPSNSYSSYPSDSSCF